MVMRLSIHFVASAVVALALYPWFGLWCLFYFVGGFLVDLDAPEEFAERCIRLLRNHRLRLQMGTEMCNRVSHGFDLHRQAEKYMHLYANTVDGKGSAAK